MMRTPDVRAWLLQSARLLGRQGLWDVEVLGDTIGAINPSGRTVQDCPSVDLAGRLLLPGFVDCHVHLLSMARHRRSLDLLAADVTDVAGLRDVLAEAAKGTAPGRWIRAVNFDELSMTDGWLPNRPWLDRITRDRPVRIQHSSQRLDMLNSAALTLIDGDKPEGDGRAYGGLRGKHPADEWTSSQELLDDVAAVSRDLVAAGVTGIQDAGADNGRSELAVLGLVRRSDSLKVRCWSMVGRERLDEAVAAPPEIAVTHVKLECLENQPELDKLVRAAVRARNAGLGIAL